MLNNILNFIVELKLNLCRIESKQDGFLLELIYYFTYISTIVPLQQFYVSFL